MTPRLSPFSRERASVRPDRGLFTHGKPGSRGGLPGDPSIEQGGCSRAVFSGVPQKVAELGPALQPGADSQSACRGGEDDRLGDVFVFPNFLPPAVLHPARSSGNASRPGLQQ